MLDTLITSKPLFLVIFMSLSKEDITTLIRKRRKRKYYEVIGMMQTDAYNDHLFISDPRNAGMIQRFGLETNLYPHLGYVLMRPKDVPEGVVHDWFSHYLEKHPYVEWQWHPKDHEWLLSKLLK